MGGPYTDVDSFAESVWIPDDADPPTASVVDVPLEGLLNRTRWLKTRVDAYIAYSTPLASLAALTAILAPTDGLPRIVKHLGLYTFDAASSATVGSPYVLAANDATPGRWIRAGNTLRSVSQFVAPMPYLVSKGTDPLAYAETARAKGADFCLSDTHYILAGGALFRKHYVRVSNGVLRFPELPQSTIAVGLQFNIDRYLRQGCTIAKVRAIVAPATGRSGLASLTPMSVGVFRSTNGSMASLSNTGDFVDDVQSSVPDYEDGHGFDFVCNQNNVVDLVNYSYHVQLWNEFGANVLAGNALGGFILYLDNVSDAVFVP